MSHRINDFVDTRALYRLFHFGLAEIPCRLCIWVCLYATVVQSVFLFEPKPDNDDMMKYEKPNRSLYMYTLKPELNVPRGCHERATAISYIHVCVCWGNRRPCTINLVTSHLMHKQIYNVQCTKFDIIIIILLSYINILTTREIKR